jgi:DNA-binding MarR family transcriptional regulator
MARSYGMSELGAMLRLAKSSLTGLVDRTERTGLVRRDPDPQDTRAVRVSLTAKGDRLAGEFYAETCRRIEELPASLGPAERDTLAGLLGRVVLGNEVPVVFMEPDEAAPVAPKL